MKFAFVPCMKKKFTKQIPRVKEVTPILKTFKVDNSDSECLTLVSCSVSGVVLPHPKGWTWMNLPPFEGILTPCW